MDGAQVNWSNTSTTSLAPGATTTLTANGGPSGSSTWTATSGTHTILANVDDTNLIVERTKSITPKQFADGRFVSDAIALESRL